ncbi:unnamed protein product [Cuscuta epithymum]|uniref:Uncharacterized protein n=1 Tax=Cuscuta epithymum TaxID=186058 RepID=A0AAV0FES3_9ASTE|nr:unnamed protein product [Cuscuta epithymum]
MASEGFDDDDLWRNPDFLEAIDEALELATTQHNLLPTQPQPAAAASQFVDINSALPLKLPQLANQDAATCTSSGSNCSVQEQEIDRLKGELDRVSELLAHKERECIMLRKETHKKEINVVPTEKVSSSTYSTGDSDSSSMIKKKLLDAWGSMTGQNLGRIFVSKLFETCNADFLVLFGFLDSSLPSNMRMESSLSGSRVAMKENMLPDHSSVSAKVSLLYSVLTKISNEMTRLDDLLDALVDLCQLKNDVVMFRALHILHEVLSYSSFTEMKDDRRSNVIVEETDQDGSSRRGTLSKETLEHTHATCGVRLNNSDKAPRAGPFNTVTCVFTSCYNYLSLFELMSQIILTHSLEHIRWEAVCIMNLILVRENTPLDREKFGSNEVFQSVSQLLKRDAGYRVNKQAVRLLYLLLNCPKIMASFFNNFTGAECTGTADVNPKTISDSQVTCNIFEGLVDCLSCSGKSAEELQVQRHSIILLAFLASSGKTGIEILLNHRPKRTKFLTIILQSVISALDLEALDTATYPEESKQRTLMIREALILLNRIASHPQYGVLVLLALTNRRDIARLTVNTASRLSHKGKCLTHCDSITQQIRESEIVELARVFQKRLYAFLEGNTLGKKPS